MKKKIDIDDLYDNSNSEALKKENRENLVLLQAIVEKNHQKMNQTRGKKKKLGIVDYPFWDRVDGEDGRIYYYPNKKYYKFLKSLMFKV